jgi:hypothetical protein
MIALKKAKLPASYPFILKMERTKILKKAEFIKVNNKKWRIYSKEQIKEIVKIIRNYMKK